MPWNGSGEFARTNGNTNGPRTWRGAQQAGRRIRTDDHDTHDEDLAQGLENCLTRDGQNSPSGPLPMNGQRHTGVANASNDNEYAGWGQAKAQITSDVNSLENRLAPSLATLVDGANISWDVDASPVAQVVLGGNRTLADPTNAVNGGFYVLNVVQDNGGSRLLSYGSAYDFGDPGEPSLTATAGEWDVLCFLYRGNRMCLVGFEKGFGG